MKTLKFVESYLSETAKVCIHFENGDIHYSGEIGNAPIRMLEHTNFIGLYGLGSEDDIFLCVEPTDYFWTWYSKLDEKDITDLRQSKGA